MAARERRIAAWQAGQAGADLEDRPAHEALADAAGTADRIVRQLRRKLDSGELDPAQLELLGPWLDRTGRLSKAVMDGNVDERRVRLSELQTIRVVEAIRLVLMRAGVDDTWATAHMVQAALAEVSGSASRPVVQAQVLSASTDRPIREEPT